MKFSLIFLPETDKGAVKDPKSLLVIQRNLYYNNSELCSQEERKMKKVPFVTKAQIEEIVKTYPTPFHIYDEKGIRENAKALYEAFSWNQGYKEYFAVKATPNPFLMQILKEYGCGSDCSSMAELVLSKAADMTK